MKIGEDDDMHFNPFVSRGRWMDNWLGFAFKSLNMWGVLFGGLIIKRQCCSWIIEGISGLGIFGLLGGKAHKKNTKKKKTLWKLGGFDCWITRVWRERLLEREREREDGGEVTSKVWLGPFLTQPWSILSLSCKWTNEIWWVIGVSLVS